MNKLIRALATLYGQFSVTASELSTAANRFAEEMDSGLANRPSRLKMLSSYIGQPSGQEQGEYLALDFGGTNLRLLAVLLEGNGNYRVMRQKSWPLRDPNSGIDLTSAETRGTDLFLSIARAIGEFAPAGEYRLGHTFSFPCRQLGINQAELIRWTKEIRAVGVEGQDVTQLLSDALAELGLTRIQPVAVINDTVGTYLTAAYAGGGVVAGSICGTGHNTAYLEPDIPDGPTVINMESGNFDPGMGNAYDAVLDQTSEKPGEQPLEKQVAGRYLGELYRLVLRGLANADVISFDAERIQREYSLPTEILSAILSDESSTLLRVGEFSRTVLGIETELDERRALKSAASLIVCRSARLTAATFLGVLRRLDPAMTGRHMIAVDGSLYEKMPDYRETLEKVLVRHLPQAAARTCLIKDGSGIGAAVAAAVASRC